MRLRSSPGTLFLTAGALVLGLAVTVAVFCVVDVILFRQLPAREPDRLVRLFTVPTRGAADLSGVSLPLFEAYQGAMKSLTGLCVYREGVSINVAIGREAPEQASAALVSADYFDVLGLETAIGRLLDAKDHAPHRVAVLSHSFARRRFGESSEAVGSSFRLNGHRYTIVGVTPPGFHGLGLESPPEVFLTLAMSGDAEPVLRGQLAFVSSAFFQAIGRLAPRATLSQVQAEANVIAVRTGAGEAVSSGPEAEDPEWHVPWPHLVPAQSVIGQESRQLAWLLTVGAGLVLLIAACDATALLLARSDLRNKELAIRMAMGATPLQVVVERFAEGLVLAAVAALFGVPLASVLIRVVLASSAQVPLPLEAATDVFSTRAFLVSVCLMTLVGIVASVVPTLRASSADPITALRVGGGAIRSQRRPLRSVLVVLQVALSLSLLTATGLLLRSVHAGSQLPAGIETRALLLASVDPARAGYDAEQALILQRRLREKLTALP